MNSKRRSDNTSGYKGVSRYIGGGYEYWRAIIHVGGRQRCLGYFNRKADAARAYATAAKELFGNFARIGNHASDALATAIKE